MLFKPFHQIAGNRLGLCQVLYRKGCNVNVKDNKMIQQNGVMVGIVSQAGEVNRVEPGGR